MMRFLSGFIVLALVLITALSAQDRQRRSGYPPQFPEAEEHIYKKVGDVQLTAYVFSPEGHDIDEPKPAIVFFFGGGWNSGSPKQFHEHCKYLASRGMVAVTADYRVASRHQVKAKSCVADAKSAVRWLRQNAKQLGLDPEKIVAGGGSAGGHIAACTGTVDGFDESGEDLTISSRPNAMALFNPAAVLASVNGKGPLKPETLAKLEQRMGVDPQELSPFHHISSQTPSTIIFHGEADSTVPYWTVEVFRDKMKELGRRCELNGYPGQPHGFFNYGKSGNKPYLDTIEKLDDFLVSLGYLPEKS